MRSPKTRPSEEEVDLAAARARAKLQSLKYNWAQDLLEGLWIARKLVLCILAVLLGIGVWLAQHEGHLTEFAWLWPQTTAMMGAVKHHLKAAGKVHPKLMFSGAVQCISASLGRGPLTSSSQGFTQT
ncbi:unnamed protein product [Effrenium voratum]|nr:unnamed protein product [Effrenium voratum]